MPKTNILVIIITYNGSHWLNNCLGSLRESTVSLDVLVVDNQSTDNTVPTIRENFPEVELIVSEENLGFGRANNVGMKRALQEDYDYAFLLNQDAWIEPDTVRVLIETHQQHPQYGIISPLHLNGKETNLDRSFVNYLIQANDIELMSDLLLPQRTQQDIYPLTFVNAAAWLISRSCLETVGGFDPLFPHYGEDQDYMQRAAYYNFKTGFTPNTHIVHDREGYVKINDMKRLLPRQYKDSLVLLKNVQRPFKTNLHIALRNEVFYAIMAIYALDRSLFIVKVKLLWKILRKAPAIRRSWKYCITHKGAYLE